MKGSTPRMCSGTAQCACSRWVQRQKDLQRDQSAHCTAQGSALFTWTRIKVGHLFCADGSKCLWGRTRRSRLTTLLAPASTAARPMSCLHFGNSSRLNTGLLLAVGAGTHQSSCGEDGSYALCSPCSLCYKQGCREDRTRSCHCPAPARACQRARICHTACALG